MAQAAARVDVVLLELLARAAAVAGLAAGEVARISSWSSSRPAGSPLMTTVRPGPCDSPAVT